MRLIRIAVLAASICAGAYGQTAPSISQVSPVPVVGPTSAGVFFSGTFVISGQNLQGAAVTTDGPLNLTGTPVINSAGTTISKGYSIGCCAPQQGQTFDLIVTSSNGSARITDTITLSATQSNCISFPAGFIPFSSISYVTAANSAGDHLVVGVPAPGALASSPRTFHRLRLRIRHFAMPRSSLLRNSFIPTCMFRRRLKSAGISAHSTAC